MLCYCCNYCFNDGGGVVAEVVAKVMIVMVVVLGKGKGRGGGGAACVVVVMVVSRGVRGREQNIFSSQSPPTVSSPRMDQFATHKSRALGAVLSFKGLGKEGTRKSPLTG